MPTLDEGFAHYEAGRLAQAELVARELLRRDGNDANAWRLYGMVALKLGQADFAIDALRKAAAIHPDVPEFHLSLANALRVMGKLEAAIESYRRALALRPDYSDTLINLGLAYNSIGRGEEAQSAWEAALRLNPDDIEALTNLGNLHRTAGRISRAIECLDRALAVNPRVLAAASNLASALGQSGRHADALAAIRRALALSPQVSFAHSNLLLNLTYQDAVAPGEWFAEHRRWNEEHAKPLAATQRAHANDRDAERRLRIGYVSPDLRDHSIAYFIEPVLAHHDRERVEVFCYANVPHEDEVTARLRGHADQWRSIAGVGDDRAAEMIRADRIDILIDLAVHTAGHRLLVFARKPAPVQATWLGYAGTSGLDAIDWRITDPVVDPPGLTESLHSEKLLRLPRTQWCYQPPASAPDVSSPPFERNGFITFGNATNLAKVTATTLDCWCAVLRAIPDAKLALKSRSMADEPTRAVMRDAFAARGVDPSRLILEPAGELSNYLDFFSSIDICLDTFPFTGGTTTCHTLWMGVPVVTRVGATSVSRVAASVLTNVGLADLIARTPEEFVEITGALAANTDRLRQLRRDLRTMMRSSPLCDGPAFVRDLEGGYREMWRQWCATP